MRLEASALEKLLQDHSDFSGVVYIREAGKVLFSGAYGYANRSDEIPNKLDTRFAIASGTKTLTGIGVCQLVEQGKLRFDNCLTEILDFSFPNFDPAVTVHHLLSHSSGVPDYFDEDVQSDYGALWKERPSYSMLAPRDFLPMFQNLPMKFVPGERFHYNNGAYVLLGLIIEAVSGQSYFDYVAQHILKPAGMNDSGFFSLNQLPARTATGYIPLENGQWRSNIFEVPIIGGADGGIFLTAPDVARFWDALFNHRFFSAAMTSEFLKAHTAYSDKGAYGYGVWILRDGESILRYYAEGGDPGASFVSTIFPQEEQEITLISNVDEGVWKLYNEILKLKGLEY